MEKQADIDREYDNDESDYWPNCSIHSFVLQLSRVDATTRDEH